MKSIHNLKFPEHKLRILAMFLRYTQESTTTFLFENSNISSCWCNLPLHTVLLDIYVLWEGGQKTVPVAK